MIRSKIQNCGLQASEFSQHQIKNCDLSNAELFDVKLILGTFSNIKSIEEVWNGTA